MATVVHTSHCEREKKRRFMRDRASLCLYHSWHNNTPLYGWTNETQAFPMCWQEEGLVETDVVIVKCSQKYNKVEQTKVK